MNIPEHIKETIDAALKKAWTDADDQVEQDRAITASAWLDAQTTQAQPHAILRESLAAYAHEAWSGWMSYMLSDGCGWVGPYNEEWCIEADKVRRWHRQMETPYADLPESEKESDREQADKILALLPQQQTEPNADEIKKLLRELCTVAMEDPDDWIRAEDARRALEWLEGAL